MCFVAAYTSGAKGVNPVPLTAKGMNPMLLNKKTDLGASSEEDRKRKYKQREDREGNHHSQVRVMMTSAAVQVLLVCQHEARTVNS